MKVRSIWDLRSYNTHAIVWIRHRVEGSDASRELVQNEEVGLILFLYKLTQELFACRTLKGKIVSALKIDTTHCLLTRGPPTPQLGLRLRGAWQYPQRTGAL